MIGASVYWLGTNIGASSGEQGEFEISAKDITSKRLIASYVGNTSDTIAVDNQRFIEFKLLQTKTLGEVVIQGQQDGIIISNQNAIKTEQITEVELGKAAYCDLAGCFETQITVQPQTTNVITYSKELRILGLSGVYNQVLIDGFPMIQGLSYTYGISGIPGTLVDNIYVSKGAKGTTPISGTFDWTDYSVTLSDVDASIRSLTVFLVYLQNTTGEAYFDDIFLSY